MLNSEYPDQLFEWLFACGMAGITCLAVLMCGFVTANSRSIIATQRARYAWTSLAVPIAAVSLYLLLSRYSFAECMGALSDLRDARFEFGWGITILFWVLMTSPLLTLLVGFWIYFKPSMYAKRQRGSYPLTSEVRRRRSRRTTYDPYPRR